MKQLLHVCTDIHYGRMDACMIYVCNHVYFVQNSVTKCKIAQAFSNSNVVG